MIKRIAITKNDTLPPHKPNNGYNALTPEKKPLCDPTTKLILHNDAINKAPNATKKYANRLIKLFAVINHLLAIQKRYLFFKYTTHHL